MTCQFSHSDGAYVLGALSPAERTAYEAHLTGCEQCTA
ncbi:MAG: anti-sigma factor family protein, partial [Natronosporangium sp.]